MRGCYCIISIIQMETLRHSKVLYLVRSWWVWDWNPSTLAPGWFWPGKCAWKRRRPDVSPLACRKRKAQVLRRKGQGPQELHSPVPRGAWASVPSVSSASAGGADRGRASGASPNPGMAPPPQIHSKMICNQNVSS